MMKQTNRNTTAESATTEAGSPWDPLIVRNFLRDNSIHLPEQEKDARLKRLGEDLAAIKELEAWSPETMKSVVPKNCYRRVSDLKGLEGAATSLLVLPGGEIVAGDSQGRLVSWLETRPGKWTKTVINEDRRVVSHLGILSDGRIVAGGKRTAGDKHGAIEIYSKNGDMGRHRQGQLLFRGDLTGLKATPEGRIIATISGTNLKVWTEAGIGRWTEEKIGSQGARFNHLIGAFEASPETLVNGIKHFQAEPDGTIALWDGEGRSFTVKTGSDGTWQVWDRHGCGPVLNSWDRFSRMHSESISRMYSESKSLPLRLRARIALGLPARGTCNQILPDGRLVVGSWDGAIGVFSQKQGESRLHTEKLEARTWSEWLFGSSPKGEGGAAVTHLQVLPDGRIISAHADGRVQVWDGKLAKLELAEPEIPKWAERARELAQ